MFARPSPARLRAGIVVCAAALLAPPSARTETAPATPLEQARAAYRDRLSTVDQQFGDSVNRLNEQYLAAVDKLARDCQGRGDLDAVLAVRGERARFDDQGRVLDGDVAAARPDLAALQRSYIAAMEKLEKDRAHTRAAVGTGYADHLAKLVRSLTQQGRIQEASEANREREELVAALPPATGPARDAGHAPPAAELKRAPATEAPRLPKAPNDYVWIYVTEKGYPARSAWVGIEPMRGGKLTRMRTDASGKVTLYEKTAGPGPYRILLLADGFPRQFIENAVAGTSYALDMTPPPPGCGYAKVDYRGFAIPAVGSFRLGYSEWTLNEPRWETVTAESPDVAFEVARDETRRSANIEGGKPLAFAVAGKGRYEMTFFRGARGERFVEYAKR